MAHNCPGADIITADVRVDWDHGTQSAEVVAMTTDREISTDLPAQVRGSSGVSVATAQVVLAPLEQVERADAEVIDVDVVAASSSADLATDPLITFVPQPIAVDDLAILAVTTNTTDATANRPEPPERWTEIGSVGVDAFRTMWIYMLRIEARDIDDDDPTRPEVGLRSIGNPFGLQGSVGIVTLTSVDWRQPIAFVAGDATNEVGQATPPDVETERDGVWVQFVADSGSLNGDVLTPPDSVTKLWETHLVGGDSALAAGYQTIAAGMHTAEPWMASPGTDVRPAFSIVAASRPTQCLVPTPLPGHWSPWRPGQLTRADRSIELRIEDTDVFVGRTVRATASTDDPTLALECADLSTRLQQRFSLAAIAHDSEFAPVVYRPGLSPIFVIDAIFRSGGFYLLAPPEPGAVFSATLMGSSEPEIFGRFSTQVPYRAASFTDDDEPAQFIEGSSFSPLTAYDVENIYRLTETQFVTPYDPPTSVTPLPQHMVLFYVDWDISEPTDDSKIALGSLVATLPEESVAIPIDAANREVWDISVPNSGLVAVQFSWRRTGGNWFIDYEVFSGGESVGTGVEAISEPEFGLLVHLAVFANQVALGGVQYIPNPTPGIPAVFNHVPNAQLDVSLGELVGTPGVQRRVSWNVLTEIVEAELGAAWIDESGIAIFRNRDSLHGTSIETTEVTTGNELTAVRWTESAEHVYGEVEVPYLPTGIDASLTLEVWRSEEIVQLEPQQERTILASLDTAVVGVVIDADGNDDPNGAGAELPVIVFGIEFLNATTVLFTIRNPSANTTIYLIRPDAETGLRIRASIGIVQDNQSFVRRDAQPNNIRTLTVRDNPWRQVADATEELADFLASEVSQPRPASIELDLRPDPRIRLGDVVSVRDSTFTMIGQRMLVTRNRLAVAAGELTHVIRAQPVRDSWFGFDQEWAGFTWNDFDAEWAGETWDDFDADPLRNTQ